MRRLLRGRRGGIMMMVGFIHTFSSPEWKSSLTGCRTHSRTISTESSLPYRRRITEVTLCVHNSCWLWRRGITLHSSAGPFWSLIPSPHRLRPSYTLLPQPTRSSNSSGCRNTESILLKEKVTANHTVGTFRSQKRALQPSSRRYFACSLGRPETRFHS